MYNVVYISLSLQYKVDIYVKMYAVRTEDSNIWILSEKNGNQDGRQIPKCLSKIDRYKLSQGFLWINYISFSDTGMEFSGYVGNILRFKNSRDKSCNSTGIQDGGQNSKWLPVMYNCFSLSLNYKADIYVKMYTDEYIEFKCMNFKWN